MQSLCWESESQRKRKGYKNKFLGEMCIQNRSGTTISLLPTRQFYSISSLQCSITCCFFTMGSSL